MVLCYQCHCSHGSSTLLLCLTADYGAAGARAAAAGCVLLRQQLLVAAAAVLLRPQGRANQYDGVAPDKQKRNAPFLGLHRQSHTSSSTGSRNTAAHVTDWYKPWLVQSVMI